LLVEPSYLSVNNEFGYSANEVNKQTGCYRDAISRAEIETNRLQNLIEQTTNSKNTGDAALKVLESIRDTNLENATQDEKRNLIAQLGIKVYPSEDGKVIRIASNLQTSHCGIDLSPQKMSIASPKL
jgi:hypothetical protein